MATSIVNFSGVVKTNSTQTTASLDVYFVPPSNIAGKLCYVQCTYIGWDYTTGVATTSRDVITVTASWAQPLSGKSTTPLASHNFSPARRVSPHGPILCHIPEGQHQVTFTMQRINGGILAGSSTTNNYMNVVLKISPANSRQPPVNV